MRELRGRGCELVSPDFALEELLSDREKITEHAGVSKLAFSFLFSMLEKTIEVFPKREYEMFLRQARKISPHLEDDPYFALALLLNAPIWSDEKAFKEQPEVKVYTTAELLEFLRP